MDELVEVVFERAGSFLVTGGEQRGEGAFRDRFDVDDEQPGAERFRLVVRFGLFDRESFEERYGKTHVPELEDMLRNSFEDIGDLLLDLKQKTIEPDPGAALQRTDFKSDTND